MKQKHTFYQRKSIAWTSSSDNNFQKNITTDNNNNAIWRGCVLTGEEHPPRSGELNHALSQVGGPAIPPFVVRTSHLHGAPTTEETYLQLSSDTNPRKIKRKKKKKMNKKTKKRKTKKRKKVEKKKNRKKEKRTSKGYS